jgi:hypothetical protein
MLWYAAAMKENHSHVSAPTTDPASFIGTWRRFGIVGPVYEIIGQDKALDNGDWLMRVRVLETGEEVSYRLKDILEDPKER